jgi:hypothetical protein
VLKIPCSSNGNRRSDLWHDHPHGRGALTGELMAAHDCCEVGAAQLAVFDQMRCDRIELGLVEFE